MGRKLYLKDQASGGIVNAFFSIGPGKFQRKMAFEVNLDGSSIVIVTLEGGDSRQNLQDEDSPRNII